MIFKALFKARGSGIKRLARGEAPTVDSLFNRYPEGRVYETHHDNIYKALIFVLPGHGLDTSSGWHDAGTRDEAARIAREMTGYPDEDKAFWKGVYNEKGDICAYILTPVAGARAVFRGRELVLDAAYFQYTGEPEGGRGGP